MPFVQVQMIEGKNEAQKRELISALTGTIASTLEIPIEGVRVILHDIPPNHYAIGGVPISERLS